MHDRLATSMMLFMAAIGVWGLFMYVTGGSLSGSFNGALAIGEVLIIAQVVFGVVLYFNGVSPGILDSHPVWPDSSYRAAVHLELHA